VLSASATNVLSASAFSFAADVLLTCFEVEEYFCVHGSVDVLSACVFCNC